MEPHEGALGAGAAGVRRLRQARGRTIAQDERTCAVFGMPGEANRLQAAEYVLHPDEVAALIRSVAARRKDR